MNKPKWTNKNKHKKKRPLYGKKLSRQHKLLFFTVGMAACIGLLLGLASLYMTKQENVGTYDETAVAKKDEPGEATSQSEQTKETIDAISFFVIQGGVFSNQENADIQAEEFVTLGYDTFNWQTEEEVYVYAGLASEESEAKALAEKMKQDDLDVYVSKREVDSAQLSMGNGEMEWLQQFVSLWNESLKLAGANKEIDKQAWDKLMDEQIATESEQELIQQLHDFWKEKETMNASGLLEMMYIYDNDI